MPPRLIPLSGWLLLAASAASLLILVLAWHIHESHRFFGEIGAEFARQTAAISKVRELRAELTQAAHHIVLFGPEEGHAAAYDEAAEQLSAEIGGGSWLAGDARELVALAERLGATEHQAIAAASAGRQAEAMELLHSPEYMDQTRLLCAQADAENLAVSERLSAHLREHGRSELVFFGVDLTVLLFAGGLWWLLGVRMRKWRALAEAELARRVSTEEQLRQAQKMEALGQMAAGVGHDFKNVLGAILGYADLALRAADRDSVDRASLEGIRAAAEQGVGVTGALLTFSQKSGPEWAPVDLWRLVTETAELLRPMLPGSVEVRIENQLPADACRVLGDRAQLQQVLVNLAINAGEAMPDGGQVRISLSGCDEQSGPERVCLSVSDTGRGIPPEIRDRIFEPFFTTKTRGQSTGLGLAIVHAIAGGHRASIDLASTPGEGSRFRLCFPRDRSAPAAPESPQATRAGRVVIASRDAYQGSVLASAVARVGLCAERVADWAELIAARERATGDPPTLLLEEGFADLSPQACIQALEDWNERGRVLVLAERGSPAVAEYEAAGFMVLERPLPLAEVARLAAGGGTSP